MWELQCCGDLAVCPGHSLGGALATLAAHSFAVTAREQGCTSAFSCYTFGAPRTGNHAWAAEYEELVPDTWHIINDQACPSSFSAVAQLAGIVARELAWPQLWHILCQC